MGDASRRPSASEVSVLFNEPKLLKSGATDATLALAAGFSALQRAEIAEMSAARCPRHTDRRGFSALQRAEIAEML